MSGVNILKKSKPMSEIQPNPYASKRVQDKWRDAELLSEEDRDQLQKYTEALKNAKPGSEEESVGKIYLEALMNEIKEKYSK